MSVKCAIPSNHLIVGDFGRFRNMNQNMEVIVENGVSENLNPAILGHSPKLKPKLLLIRRTEQKLSIHCSSDAMVGSWSLRWIEFDSRSPHALKDVAGTAWFQPMARLGRRTRDRQCSHCLSLVGWLADGHNTCISYQLPFVRALSGQRLVQISLRTWTLGGFLFLYLPIAVLVAYSFNSSRLGVVWQGFTLKWYDQLLANRALVTAAKNSLIIASLTTALSVVLGTGGAWILHRYRFRFAKSLQTLIALPMVMPEILMGVSLLIFFTVIHWQLGFTTVIIAHTTFCFPFVLVAVQARLQGLDPSLEEAALDLGATPLKAFWLVIIPSLRPALLAGGLMAFTLSMDEIIVTVFTTGAASVTLPLRIFGMAKVGLNPMLNALSALFIVVTAAVVLFSEYLKRLRR